MNPHVAIDVDLDATGKKTYALRYDANALAELEHVVGRGVLELFDESTVKSTLGSVQFVRAALVSGVRWQHKAMTPEQMGRLMDLTKLAHYIQQIVTALKASLGIGQGGDAEPADPTEQTHPAA